MSAFLKSQRMVASASPKKAGQDIGLVVHSIMRVGLLSMSIQPLIRGAASDAILVAMSSLFTEN